MNNTKLHQMIKTSYFCQKLWIYLINYLSEVHLNFIEEWWDTNLPLKEFILVSPAPNYSQESHSADSRGFKRRRISPGGPSRTLWFKGEPVSARSDLPAPGRASNLLRIFSFHLRSRGRRGLTLFVDPPSTTPYSTLLIYLDPSPL